MKPYPNSKKRRALKEIEKNRVMDRYQEYKRYMKTRNPDITPFDIWIQLCSIDLDFYGKHIPGNLDKNAILLAIKLS